jgi:hypothetical protein
MQHDRFAREIVAFLTLLYAARSRRLMGNSLGGLTCLAIFWTQFALSYQA